MQPRGYCFKVVYTKMSFKDLELVYTKLFEMNQQQT